MLNVINKDFTVTYLINRLTRRASMDFLQMNKNKQIYNSCKSMTSIDLDQRDQDRVHLNTLKQETHL